MSFIGSMLGGSSGAGFQASGTNIQQPVTADQATAAMNQSQQGISQQQQFLNALAQQNGAGNLQNVFSQYQNVANGTGPNPAAAQLAQATGQNVANQAALAAGQRGAGANVGLMARQIGQQGAATQQQAAGQAATLQAQQQLGALGQLGNIAGQQVGAQQSALSGLNQASQGEQGQLLGAIGQQNSANVGMQSNINNANAGIAGINAQGQQQILGGALGGVGAALGLSHGGTVPHYAMGGMQPAPIMQGMQQMFNPSSMPKAGFANQYFNGNQQPMMGGMTQLGQGIGNLFKSKAPDPLPGNTMSDYQNLPDVKGSSMNSYQNLPDEPAMSTGAPMMMAGEAAPGSEQTAAQGGMMKGGGNVPGKAKVHGDSPTNDIVSAKLSPGEIVIPRSITMGENAPEKAAEFVRQQLMKHSATPAKKKYYAAGVVGPEDGSDPETSAAPVGPQIDLGTTPSSDPIQPSGAQPYDVHSDPSFQAQLSQMNFKDKPDDPRYQALEEEYAKGHDSMEKLEDAKSANAKEDVANVYKAAIARNAERARLGLAPVPVPAAPENGASPGSAPGIQNVSADNMPNMGGGNAPQNSDPYGMNAYANDTRNGYMSQLLGLKGQANAQGAAAAAEGRVAGQQAAAQQDFQDRSEAALQDVMAHHDELMNAVQNGQIKPQQFLSEMQTPQKVSTAIGLILGGIGGGLTHQENPALKFLNAQIDRDVQGQVQNLNKKQSLVSMNLQKYGDMRQAMNATYAQMQGIAALKLKQAAATSGNQLAQSRALQAAGALQDDMAPRFKQIAYEQAAMGSGANGLPAALDPAIDRRIELNGTVFHAPDKSAAEKVRPQVEALNDLDSISQRIDAFNKNVGTTYNPAGQNAGLAQGLNREMDAAIAKTQAAGGNIGRLVDKFQDMAPRAGAFAQSKQLGKAEALHEFSNAQKAGLIRSYLTPGMALGK